MSKEQYLIFLSDIYTKRDGSHLSYASVDKYGNQATKKVDQYLHRLMPQYETMFDISSYSELLKLKQALLSDKEFIEEDNTGNRMFSAGFNRYLEFASGQLLINKEKSLHLLDKKEEVKYSGVMLHEDVRLIRDRIKILQVEKACNYTCQIDPTHETFIAEASNMPYLEGHHIIPLNQQDDFDYSLDCYANIIALCPTCHRFFHYGLKTQREEKLIKLYENRAERLSNSGIVIDRKEFLERTYSGIMQTIKYE